MKSHPKSPLTDAPIQAAQYVRMSTEHQQYSIDNQSDAIKEYARMHGMDIVKTYSDAGKSGLRIENRPGLRQMIEDVEHGSPGYSVILVYDISRWGRFQDADESAYYEYRCRRANIAVHYCVETFANDGSFSAALLKTIKRTMAAEYSRELSAKVFAGKSRLTEIGFRQGGTAGYGLRRLLIDETGNRKFVLESGQKKSIATDRVILIPGPREEIVVVNDVFRRYALEHCSTTEIARSLNERGIPAEGGRPWTRHIIRWMVTNPKYIGANVTNRLSAKLCSHRVSNPPEMWIRRDNAFEAIVDLELFRKAEEEAHARSSSLTDEELLERLRRLLRKQGKLSKQLLKASSGMPSGEVYTVRFGGLPEAYKRIGYKPYRNLSWVERDQPLVQIRREFITRVVDTLKSFGGSVQQDVRRQYLSINENLNVRISIVRCRQQKRINSWRFQLCSPYEPDVTLFARLAPGNEAILDYFCVPRSRKKMAQITVSSQTPAKRDIEQFHDLTFLKDFAEWGKKRGKGSRQI
jgi:DNA invertase Pin-like site-specific DNA recombinase